MLSFDVAGKLRIITLAEDVTGPILIGIELSSLSEDTCLRFIQAL